MIWEPHLRPPKGLVCRTSRAPTFRKSGSEQARPEKLDTPSVPAPGLGPFKLGTGRAGAWEQVLERLACWDIKGSLGTHQRELQQEGGIPWLEVVAGRLPPGGDLGSRLGAPRGEALRCGALPMPMPSRPKGEVGGTGVVLTTCTLCSRLLPCPGHLIGSGEQGPLLCLQPHLPVRGA